MSDLADMAKFVGLVIAGTFLCMAAALGILAAVGAIRIVACQP